MIDPRTPILVGCGQITDAGGETSNNDVTHSIREIMHFVLQRLGLW